MRQFYALITPAYVMLLILFKRFSRAEVVCKKDLDRFPKSSLTINLLASIYKKQKRFFDASQEFIKLLELNSNEPANYNDLLHSLFKAQRYDLVIRYSLEYVNKDFVGLRRRVKSSYIDDVNWYLAFTYYCLENHKEAKKYFEKIKHINNWEKKYNISQYIAICSKDI